MQGFRGASGAPDFPVLPGLDAKVAGRVAMAAVFGFEVVKDMGLDVHETHFRRFLPKCKGQISTVAKSSFFCSNISMKDHCRPYNIERFLVDHVTHIIDQTAGLDHSKFARRAFHDQDRGEKAAVDHWKRMRQENKPARVTMEDAIRIAQALGYPFNDFVDILLAKYNRLNKPADNPGLALAAENSLDYGQKNAVNS